jgi:acetylornithine deacetylase/succinyl-diaminopimelate desuccinylase-like protein
MKTGLLGCSMAVALAGCATVNSSSALPVATPAQAPRSLPDAPVKADGNWQSMSTREILERLVAVDTSRGNETAALRPVAEWYRQAGVEVDIVESAPGRGNLIARLRGDGSKRPLLLVSHIDVVPVEGQPWTTDPFRATEKDSFLQGRGVVDNKGAAASIIRVTLDLARQKVPLARDVIVALTAGEETGGDAGVRWLVENRRELIDAEIALNEGGALELEPDFSRMRLVSVGIAQKSFQSFRLVASGKSGHSSMPIPGNDPVVRLAHALIRVGSLTFTPHLLPALKDTVRILARDEAPPLRDALERVARSAPKISPEDDVILSSDRFFKAITRTNCVTTMLSASPQENVLPSSAEAIVNCRILPDETVEQTRQALEQAIADSGVTVTATRDFGIGPPAPAEGPVVDAIRETVEQLWPGVPVILAMGAGGNDSRHLLKVGILAYGIGVAPSTRDEYRAGRTAHAPNERRPVQWIDEGTKFLRELVLRLAAR